MDNTPDIQATITPLVEALEELGVPYHIGGSVASSLYGLPRLTIDVDIVADLRLGQVRPLIDQLQPVYYIDEDMIRDAIKRRSSFNIIHLDTIYPKPTSQVKKPANYSPPDSLLTTQPVQRT